MTDHTYHEAPVHDPQALPVMVPAKLVGRDVLLAKAYNDLKNNDAVLLYGPSGIGKTALAATLASAYSELPGGVIWMSVLDAPLEALVVRAARAFGMDDIAMGDNPVGKIDRLAAAFEQQKPLLVLDGSPNKEAAADFVAQCAGATPVLVTADSRLDGPWTPIEVPPLQTDHAAALFGLIANIETKDDAGAVSLVGALGGSPLAISIAAAAVKFTPQTPTEFLNAMPQSAAGAAPASLLALTAAFRRLPSALQGLLLMVGATFRGQGSADLLSMISGAPVEGVNQALGLLVNRHLVERFTRYGAPYYRLHPLVKEFAHSWLRGSQRLAALENKVRDSIVAHASRFSGQHDRLAAEIETYVGAAQWAAETDDLDTPSQLAASLLQAGDFVTQRAFGYELQQIRRLSARPTVPFPAYTQPTTLPIASPPPPAAVDEEFDETLDAEDDFDEDTFDDGLDEDADVQDDDLFDDELDEDELDILDEELDEEPEPDEDELPLPMMEAPAPILPAEAMSEMARLRGVLVQARQQGDERRQAETLKAMAALYASDKTENEAISTYAEALTHFEAVNDRGEMLNVLEALADLEARTDNLEAAALHAARGVTLADQLGEVEKQKHLLAVLGDARQQLGESEPAIDAYEEALELVRAGGDARSEAILLFKLGYAYMDSNDPAKSSELLETALKMFKAQGRRDYEGRVLGALGAAYGEMGRWTEAINFHTSALHIAREVGDRTEEALQLNNLGYASVQAGQLGQAVLRYRQALHLAYQSGQRDDIVSTTVELANVLIQSPRHLLITELLVDAAIEQDASDRDLRKLKERITTDKIDAQARGVNFIPADGTAQLYAENAYDLLDEA